MARIEWDLRGLKGLRRTLNSGNDPDYKQMLQAVGTVYLQYLHRRYLAASRSPGNPWKDIAPATKRRRRKGKGLGTPSILVDTGMLRMGLTPGAPGNLLKVMSKKVRCGYANTSHSKGMTFAKLADIHHFGKGHNPPRTIFVEPDDATARRMKSAIATGIQRIGAKQHGSR